MREHIKRLGLLCEELDALDEAIFDENTDEETADIFIDKFNATVEKVAELLESISGEQINRKTGELMARAKRGEIMRIVRRVKYKECITCKQSRN